MPKGAPSPEMKRPPLRPRLEDQAAADAEQEQDDGVTWKVLTTLSFALKCTLTFLAFYQHAVSRIRNIQKRISTANPNNPGFARQKLQGKLWVRERLDVLLDPRSFSEVGSLTGRPIYGETTGEVKNIVPA